MSIITYGPFPNNVNVGYIQYDTVTGGQFMYMGGPPGDILNWKLIGGELLDQPDTTGWGDKQKGARWYNKSRGNFFGWNGSIIVMLG
jgi:hypothetical protein